MGCLGGHGRTGTALAACWSTWFVAEEAVSRVRATYGEKAVETNEQMDFVAVLGS